MANDLLKCKNCGAELKGKSFYNFFTCEYCGTKNLIDKEILDALKEDEKIFLKQKYKQFKKDSISEELNNLKNYQGSEKYQKLYEKYQGRIDNIPGISIRKKDDPYDKIKVWWVSFLKYITYGILIINIFNDSNGTTTKIIIGVSLVSLEFIFYILKSFVIGYITETRGYPDRASEFFRREYVANKRIRETNKKLDAKIKEDMED